MTLTDNEQGLLLMIQRLSREVSDMTIRLQQLAGGGPSPKVQWSNATAATAVDFDNTNATPLVSTPQGAAQVFVNGVQYKVGDGVKTDDCYFSADAGATAKTHALTAAGDQLFWVGSVAGFEIAPGDKLLCVYNA